MLLNSYFIESHSLIVEIINGEVTLDSLIELRLLEIERGWIRPGVNSLGIFHRISTAITHSEVLAFAEWTKTNLTALAGSKTALIVDTPITTAFSQIVASNVSDIRAMRTFSTLSSAANWLGVPVQSILEAVPEAGDFNRK
ncbi:hypothetical protein [Pelagicoccus sp. SDUM812003]|uniref:hypothetical protein n=1 Tax=Pelagicoccus sp. SDUM812003 TaxID=3041267 RepID=UPI00280F5040|nr:hypothetical protein [Pelagicoccus sp. SDUM812003]MDQ8201389.1 hypothetical protein [Pelagicoccus sp. SDUM812003]